MKLSITQEALKSRLRTALLLFAVSCLALLFFTSARTSALSGADFNPGRIIDDAVFYNKSSMTESQVQEFLNSKVTSCDTNGTRDYTYRYNPSTGRVNNSADSYVTTTRAVYGDRVANYDGDWRGSRAPYVCLKDKTFATFDIAPESGICNGYSAAGNESAARIIWKVAQSCDINPQTLLVLLQKEQSLITETWPWGIQYDKATGAFCPDNPPLSWSPKNCDPEYLGFQKQVYFGAHRFKKYKANPNSYNYVAGRVNSILWNPNSACGRSDVFIENQATAALYIYTPYRPNQAALDNLYGTGDGCSAYGNRNFWRMWSDWFGSTVIIDETVPRTTLSTQDNTSCQHLMPVPYSYTSYCHSGLVGDFNGDKYQDVAALYKLGDGKSFGLWVFPGSSTGIKTPIFQRNFSAKDYWDINSIKFASGDINGDKIDDLVALVSSPYKGVTIVEAYGSSANFLSGELAYKYNPSVFNALKTGWYWSNLDVSRQAGDFNGDGYDDVAINYVMNDGKSFNLWVFPGSSTGLLSPSIQRSFASSEYWDIKKTKFLVGDFNADKTSDIGMLIHSPTGGISLVQIFGSKTTTLKDSPGFTYDPKMFDPIISGWYWESADPVRFTGDVTGDLADDIVITYTLNDSKSYNVWVLPGSSTGLKSPVLQQRLSIDDGFDISSDRYIVGDFRNDWVADMTSLSTDHYGGVYVQDVNGNYQDHIKSTPIKNSLKDTYKAVHTGWYWRNLR